MLLSHNRRWLRFSLRALFVITTLAGVIAGWVRWNYDFVLQRRAVMKSMVQYNLELWEDTPALRGGFKGFGGISCAFKVAREAPRMPPRIPWIRALLGDKPIGCITVEGPSRAFELTALFPEASICYDDGYYRELFDRRTRPWAY
jgi:hypothetical protein